MRLWYLTPALCSSLTLPPPDTALPAVVGGDYGPLALAHLGQVVQQHYRTCGDQQPSLQ
jgi:hypothetical protein